MHAITFGCGTPIVVRVPDPDMDPEPVPALAIVSMACPVGAKVCPTRDLTVEISDTFTDPDVPTSNKKFVALALNPDRAFTALISFESTARLLFTSPCRKPTDTEAYADPAPSLSDIVTRELLGIPAKFTDTSDATVGGIMLAEPILTACGSTAVTVTGAIAAELNWKTMVCPDPIARGSTVIAPPMGCVVSILRSCVPFAAWVFRDCTAVSVWASATDAINTTNAKAMKAMTRKIEVGNARPFARGVWSWRNTWKLTPSALL